MTSSRVRGIREGAVLALAILLGPALALAAAAPGDQDVRHAAAPTSVYRQGGGAVQAEGSESTVGSVAGRVSVSALTVRLELSQVVVRAGRSVQVRAIVANESATSVADVRVTIRSVPSGITFRPAEPRTVRRILPARSETVTWSACGQAVGTYSLVVTADVAGVLVTSPPQPLTITAGKAC